MTDACCVNIDAQVLQKRESEWQSQNKEIVKTFYKKYLNEKTIQVSVDHLDRLMADGSLDLLYNINKSITQSYRSRTGKTFENCIQQTFEQYNISYSKQVVVDSSGCVVRRRSGVKLHTLDFVIPKISLGDCVYDPMYTVVSVKTTVRERFLQDAMYPNLVIISLEQVNYGNIQSIKVCPITKQLTKFIEQLSGLR